MSSEVVDVALSQLSSVPSVSEILLLGADHAARLYRTNSVVASGTESSIGLSGGCVVDDGASKIVVVDMWTASNFSLDEVQPWAKLQYQQQSTQKELLDSSDEIDSEASSSATKAASVKSVADRRVQRLAQFLDGKLCVSLRICPVLVPV